MHQGLVLKMLLNSAHAPSSTSFFASWCKEILFQVILEHLYWYYIHHEIFTQCKGQLLCSNGKKKLSLFFFSLDNDIWSEKEEKDRELREKKSIEESNNVSVIILYNVLGKQILYTEVLGDSVKVETQLNCSRVQWLQKKQ